VIAKTPCGDSNQSTTVTVPATCANGVTTSSTNASAGNGTSASPYVAPSNGSLVVKLNAGATAISAASASFDGGSGTTMASPWTYTWPDTGDGATHTLTFNATAGCNQTLPTVYIQGSAPGCHLRTAAQGTVVSVVTPPSGYDAELDITFTSLVSNTITMQSIDITVDVPKKGSWVVLRMPDGTDVQTASPSSLPANATNSSAVAYTKTFNLATLGKTFTVTSGTPKTVKMLVTISNGGGSLTASSITGVTAHYKQAASGSTIFDCQLVP